MNKPRRSMDSWSSSGHCQSLCVTFRVMIWVSVSCFKYLSLESLHVYKMLDKTLSEQAMWIVYDVYVTPLLRTIASLPQVVKFMHVLEASDIISSRSFLAQVFQMHQRPPVHQTQESHFTSIPFIGSSHWVEYSTAHISYFHQISVYLLLSHLKLTLHSTTSIYLLV